MRPPSGLLRLEQADALAERVRQRAPGWVRGAGLVVEEIGVAARQVVDATSQVRSQKAKAIQALFVQATNDYLDLMIDASMARGRPAIRAARTLFEHHIAALEIDVDPALADQWLDHMPMSGVAQASLELPEQHLRGKVLKAYRHRMSRLRKDSERDATRATGRWGGWFRRQWHPDSVFDRATRLGLDDHYNFYRFASAPVHGSHAGMVGLVKTVAGLPILRTGAAIAPTPAAVLYGTTSMRAIVEVAAQFVDEGLDRFRAALDKLDELWPEYFVALEELDSEVWPDSPSPNIGALMVVAPDGLGTWFECLPDELLARQARSAEVRMHEEQKRPFDVLLERILPSVDHGSVGVLLLDSVIADPGRGPWIDVPDLVDSAPFVINRNGHLGVPSDFNPPPRLDDLLRGLLPERTYHLHE
jgi:hypothetical protein